MANSMPMTGHPSGILRERAHVRWGIIGCGDVTEIKSGPGFQKADRSRLVAVMRRNAAGAADYARRHGVPRWYESAGALIADPEVDAVYVATPPGALLECALKIAAAGKPAYVEKPMARNTAECDAMIEAFAAARVPLYVAYYRRRLPRFLLVKDLLARRAIGQITGVSYLQTASFHRRHGGWRTEVASAGGGHVLDLGSHTIDLMDELFGPLHEVAGMAANVASDYAVEDSVAMSFMAGEVPGAASWNFAAAIAQDTFRISGTEGQITFSVFDAAPVLVEGSQGVTRLERENPPHVQQPLIQSIVDDLLGLDVCPSTGESARRTSHVLDTVLSSYYGGRQDAFWGRADSWPGRRG
jgi:predicted dehydrogenase